MHSLLRFIVKNVSKYMDIPELNVKMSDFKMADDLEKKKLLINSAMGASSDSLVSKTTVQKELDLDPEQEYKNINEDLRRRIELKIEEAEGTAEAQGAATIVQALYGADAQIEQQRRLETAQEETQAKHDQQKNDASNQNAPGIQQEIAGMAQQKGHDPNTISIPNLILLITQRFSRLARIDPQEFGVRMLAMKSATPSLYTEVYTNLKEMNLIAADTMPAPVTKDLLNQGQVPQFAQGGTTALEPASPVEAGANPGVLAQDSRLPEQRPPRSVKAPI
jgi:hypothetical protein